MSLKGTLTVATVALAIIFMTCTSQIFVIWPFISPFNLHSISILVSFNFFIFMTLINYFLTCYTNPGTVPKHWMPRQQAYIEVKKSTHTPRYCKTCSGYKPPRTHHCSCCNRCVLKMDHHCPWVNNCVGFSNYCHFIRFLVYVDISTVYLLVLLCCRLAQLVRDMRHYNIHPSPVEACFLSINLIMSTVVLITVGILTCYHTYCITTNTTTIEGWEKGRSLTIKGMGKIQNVKCPYDQGIFKNIQLVLGRWPIFWLIPQRITGNGLDFPINTKYVMEQQDDDEELTLQKTNSMTSLTRPISYASSIVISPPEPIKSKNTGRSHNHLPQTPSSVMTFTSTVTTLVDYTSNNNYHPKLPKSELEEDYR